MPKTIVDDLMRLSNDLERLQTINTDLLEALEALTSAVESAPKFTSHTMPNEVWQHREAVIEQARAAIAKAKGE